ncbi:MAG: Histidine ammonia-lyase [bacterium]|nr:Histidine ammonia-lyase [bacterium]
MTLAQNFAIIRHLMKHILDGKSLTLEILAQVAQGGAELELSGEALNRMESARRVIEGILHSGRVMYGVNTGFGKLAEVRISPDDLQTLQTNLILSHACGTGQALSAPEVRAVMALKLNALLTGYSGCRTVLAHYLHHLLAKDVLPVIPEKGSVGASGDLAPLAHLALVLIGRGEAWVQGQKVSGREALRFVDLQPLELAAKEGLALINGTQFMAAVGSLAWLQLHTLARSADVCGAMSAEALLCTPVAFDQRIQVARGYAGQQQVAANLRRLMADSPIRNSHLQCQRVQDAYSVRCLPQVHGAVRDYLQPLRDSFAIELNAATDNPLVFAEDNEVLSGGNFHGHPLAIACDLIAMLATHLAGMSERRIAFMMDTALSELPPFLVKNSGLHSGFMIAHVAAASLVSENKVLSHPASVDSIPTSANQEDFVSMGAHAAVKARTAVQNAMTVLAIELVCACQALDLRLPLAPGPAAKAVRDLVRAQVPPLTEDRVLADDLAAATRLLASGAVLREAENVIGEL